MYCIVLYIKCGMSSREIIWERCGSGFIMHTQEDKRSTVSSHFFNYTSSFPFLASFPRVLAPPFEEEVKGRLEDVLNIFAM